MSVLLISHSAEGEVTGLYIGTLAVLRLQDGSQVVIRDGAFVLKNEFQPVPQPKKQTADIIKFPDFSTGHKTGGNIADLLKTTFLIERIAVYSGNYLSVSFTAATVTHFALPQGNDAPRDTTYIVNLQGSAPIITGCWQVLVQDGKRQRAVNVRFIAVVPTGQPLPNVSSLWVKVDNTVTVTNGRNDRLKGDVYFYVAIR